MDNRISPISAAETAARQTPKQEFADVLTMALGTVANFVGGGVPILSAALSHASKTTSALGALESAAGLKAAGAAGPIGTRGDGWGLLDAQKAMQEQGQSFNMQYLALQERMQKESREYTTLTNIMKVRHDSAKAAINNIR